MPKSASPRSNSPRCARWRRWTPEKAPGDEASILKVVATEVAQLISELGIELAGGFAARSIPDRDAPTWREGLETIPLFAVPATSAYFFTRAQSIYGGTNEIQRNIIFRMLGR